MSFFDGLFMADATATGKNITSGHFQIIVNGFQPVFHIHRFFVNGVYLSNIKVGGDNLIESIKLLFSKIVLCYFYIRTTDFVVSAKNNEYLSMIDRGIAQLEAGKGQEHELIEGDE